MAVIVSGGLATREHRTSSPVHGPVHQTGCPVLTKMASRAARVCALVQGWDVYVRCAPDRRSGAPDKCTALFFQRGLKPCTRLEGHRTGSPVHRTECPVL